jgi:hypothetical protein
MIVRMSIRSGSQVVGILAKLQLGCHPMHFAATKLSCMRGMNDSKNRTGQGELLSDAMNERDCTK